MLKSPNPDSKITLDEEYLKQGMMLLKLIPQAELNGRSFEKCFMPKKRKATFTDFLQFRRVEHKLIQLYYLKEKNQDLNI